jgi:hypothetical protein
MLVLYFLKSVLVKNPIKLSLIAVSFILGILILKLDRTEIKKRVIVQYTDGSEYHYVTKSGDEYRVKSFDEPMEVIDDSITFTEIHPLVAISYVLLFLIVILLFLAPIGIDDSATWDFSECLSLAKLSLVRCEVEDDVYYYHYRGKLLIKSDCQILSSNLEKFLKEPIGIYPDFPGTKKERRDKKLKELFNEN